MKYIYECAGWCGWWCTSVGADHALWVLAELPALPAGQVAFLLELAGISKPAFIALAGATVAVAAVCGEDNHITRK